jgi:hypothetical protein
VIIDLYVENGVGRAITETINLFTPKHGVTAHWQHDIHPQMAERAQHGDEWWIEDIASRSMAILTQDRALLGIEEAAQAIITGEREAVIKSKAHVIAFGSARYNTWEKLRCVVNHWDAITTMLESPGPQAIVIMLSTARVEVF